MNVDVDEVKVAVDVDVSLLIAATTVRVDEPESPVGLPVAVTV